MWRLTTIKELNKMFVAKSKEKLTCGKEKSYRRTCELNAQGSISLALNLQAEAR
nr:MAG TPA: hypothetical protein [Caudoviricetes sp.]